MSIKDNLKTYVENKPLYNDWKKEKELEEKYEIVGHDCDIWIIRDKVTK